MTNSPIRRFSLLRLSEGLELLTGAALLAAPSIVTELLLGSGAPAQRGVLARLLGGGLVSFGVTGLMSAHEPNERGALVGFTLYNGLTAAILGIAGSQGAAHGVLLWPVVAFHSGVAVLLLPQALSPSGHPVVAGLT